MAGLPSLASQYCFGCHLQTLSNPAKKKKNKQKKNQTKKNKEASSLGVSVYGEWKTRSIVSRCEQENRK